MVAGDTSLFHSERSAAAGEGPGMWELVCLLATTTPSVQAAAEPGNVCKTELRLPVSSSNGQMPLNSVGSFFTTEFLMRHLVDRVLIPNKLTSVPLSAFYAAYSELVFSFPTLCTIDTL